MTSKTWFLPPDFTFLPDGQIALGAVIPHPRRPTVTLASLAEHPTISLPEVRSVVEKNRNFSAEKTRSVGFGLFAKFLDMAGSNNGNEMLWYKNKSFGAVDHEVRTYNGAFTAEVLKAIVALDGVKGHINSGRFGKRCVYIISGLRLARQSFTVTDEEANKMASSLDWPVPAPLGTRAIMVGAHISGSGEFRRKHSYETAPGIVFAYRLHMARAKHSGVEAELFSDRSGFFSGEGEDEESDEMEVIEVDGPVLRQDLDTVDDWDERPIGQDGDSYITFGSATGMEWNTRC